MIGIEPVSWIENTRARSVNASAAAERMFPPGTAQRVRKFHKEIPANKMTPLKNLGRLADWMGLGGIWVKDESQRLNLGSFKVLGGSYAIYRHIQQRLGIDEDLTFNQLSSPEVRSRLGDLTFAAATDGNHGRGVAWAARQLGFESVIYVHKTTSQARIAAIERNGGRVEIIDGTYDDAVRQVNEDARKFGWQVISDTSWPGYEDIPRWVMQGYTTIFAEAQEQLAAQGLVQPTHIFMQAGVGALAASGMGYYATLSKERRPWSVVVEPDEAACLYASIEKGDGKPHSFPGELNTIMAGLACGDPNPLAWEILYDCADVFIKCPDYVAAKGMRVYGMPLTGDPSIISGESGAVTLGALMFIMERPEYAPLRERLGLDRSSQVLLVNSERNTDPDDFRRVVWEGSNPVPEPYRGFAGPYPNN